MESKYIYLIVMASAFAIWLIGGVYLALNYDRLFGKRKIKGHSR